MRQGNVLARWVFAACLSLSGPVLIACDDENDPKTWVKKLGDDKKRPGATERLSKLFEERMRSTNPVNNCADGNVKKFLDTALQPMVDQFNAHPDEVSMRQKAMAIFVQCKDPRALSAIISSVVFKPGVSDSESLAELAIGAIKSWGPDLPADKKNDVINALVTAVQKANGGADRTKSLRARAIEALGSLKAPAAVAPLTELIMKPINELDPQVTTKAIEALGDIGSPDGVDGIIYALFLNLKGVNVEANAKFALGKIGLAAAKPKILELLNNQNDKVKKLVNQYNGSSELEAPGWYAEAGSNHQQYYASRLLSDFGFPEAIDPLIAIVTNKELPELIRGQAAKSLSFVASSTGAETRAKVLTALRGLITEVNMQGLVDMLETGRVWIGTYALDALANMGDTSAVPDILKLLRAPELNPKKEEPAKLVALLGIRVKLLQILAQISRKTDLGVAADIAKVRADLATVEASGPSFKGQADYTKGMLTIIEKYIALGKDCADGDVACLLGKLKSDAPKDDLIKVLRLLSWDTPADKQEQVRKALLADGIVNHFQNEVRVSVFFAIDAVSPKGSQEAVDRIFKLLADEKDGNESKKITHLYALGLVARLNSRK